MGSVPAPQTNVAFDKVKELVAAPADENELLAISHEVCEIRRLTQVSKFMAPSTRAVRERLHDLSHGAQCGPSGWRNYLLQAIGQCQGGNESIATWQNLWPRGTLQPEVIEFFAAATVTPVDGGWSGEKGPAGLQKVRKLRPIACSEVLVKLGEGIDIASNRQTLNACFGDNQLGNGEPMAAPLIVCATDGVEEET